jgi:hypothetical protein
MIWLLAHPLPHSPVRKFDWRHTGKLRKRVYLLTGEGGREWTRSRIIRLQESLVLDKSSNTLCVTVSNLVKFFMMIFRSYGFWISALNKADNARISAPGQKNYRRKKKNCV